LYFLCINIIIVDGDQDSVCTEVSSPPDDDDSLEDVCKKIRNIINTTHNKGAYNLRGLIYLEKGICRIFVVFVFVVFVVVFCCCLV
jgi:hypothetical protein